MKETKSGGGAGGSISDHVSIISFSLGQQEDVCQDNVIIAGSASFLLATPWQSMHPGREAEKMRHLLIE